MLSVRCSNAGCPHSFPPTFCRKTAACQASKIKHPQQAAHRRSKPLRRLLWVLFAVYFSTSVRTCSRCGISNGFCNVAVHPGFQCTLDGLPQRHLPSLQRWGCLPLQHPAGHGSVALPRNRPSWASGCPLARSGRTARGPPASSSGRLNLTILGSVHHKTRFLQASLAQAHGSARCPPPAKVSFP